MNGRLALPMTILGTSVPAVPAIAQGSVGTDFAPWNYGWGMGAMMFSGGLVMLMFWGGVILVLALLVRWIIGSSSPQSFVPSRQTPLEILQERYARGEIDQKEYDERRRTLSAS